MKLLLLTDRLEAGGAETHIAQLAVGLRRMGVEVTLLSEGGKTADTLSAQGFCHISLPVGTRNPLRWLLLRRRLIKLQRREKFDIIHTHARIPALLTKGFEHLGCATAVTVHARFSVNPLLRRICNWGERTVAVSEDLRTYVMREYRVPAERITVIANGIDCNSFSPSPAEHTDAAPCPRILFASRLDRDCSLGAELLLRIAPALVRQFPTVRISIAGGGSELFRIKALAAETNHIIGANAVTVLGHVEQMAPLLQKQDIFVGVSRAAMEASACGCSVVLCGNEGYLGVLDGELMREAMLTNFCCRDARAADIYRLQNDLVFLLADPNARARIASEARDTLIARFGAERMCRETLMLYHRMQKHLPVRTLAIGGYFGCGNLGDDAILQGFLDGMHAIASDIRILALTGSPRRDRARFGISCVHRRNPFAVAHAMRRADVFLCGGGSLLQNGTSRRSLAYYLHLITLAHMFGAHPMLYAAGIGPLYGNRALRSTAKALSHCDYLSLRDPDSLLLAASLGIDRAKLRLGADPAMLLPTPPTSRFYALQAAHKLPRCARFFCIVLKGGVGSTDERRTVVAAARMLCRRHALFPIVAIFDRTADTYASHEAAAQLGGRTILFDEPSDAVSLLSSMELVLTMRLHAMILSTVAAAPAIGIPTDSTDAKLHAFAHLAGQHALTRKTLSVAALVDAAEKALAQKRSLRPFYADTTADLRKKAKKDLENITAMIYNISSKH